jgi:hypothetical protein
MMCLALHVACAVMYDANALLALLPIAQKLVSAFSTGNLLRVFYDSSWEARGQDIPSA